MINLRNIPDGKITRAVREGLELRGKLLADGMSQEAADEIVGAGLKAVWQSDRAEPWHYYCEKCKDSGMVIVRPSYTEQRRLVQMYGDDPAHQDYMAQCDPCHWRDRERGRRIEREQTQARRQGSRR